MDTGNRWVYAIMKGLSAIACRLGHGPSLGVGRAFADALFLTYCLTPYRGFIEGNIGAAYPEWSPREVREVARGHVRQLVTSIVELMRFPTLVRRDLGPWVELDGWAHMEAARARGRGVIVLTAHFGNWELLGAAIARRIPLSALVQPPSKDAFERLFIEYRDLFGIKTHPNTGPVSLRPILRALKRNEAVVLLSDQHGEAQEAIARLFGHPVSVPTGAFYLAEKTGATIVPAFIVRDPSDRHRLAFEPELVATTPQEFAQAYSERLEQRIRANPDQWLWVHNRWAREGELRLAAAV